MEVMGMKFDELDKSAELKRATVRYRSKQVNTHLSLIHSSLNWPVSLTSVTPFSPLIT